MAQRPRIEFPGAIYYGIRCGDHGEANYFEDEHWVLWESMRAEGEGIDSGWVISRVSKPIAMVNSMQNSKVAKFKERLEQFPKFVDCPHVYESSLPLEG